MKKIIEVVAAIIIKEDKYFCAQRKDQGKHAKKWEFPGGKVELFETKEKALEREIKEELNLEIKVMNHFMTVRREYKDFILELHAYICKILSGKLELVEHLDYKWITIKEMKDMDFADADIHIIEKLSFPLNENINNN